MTKKCALRRLIGTSAVVALFVGACLYGVVPAQAAEAASIFPKISEVYPDAPGSISSEERPHEFIELMNLSSEPLNLQGFQLRSTSSEDKYTDLEGTIPAHGYTVINVSFALLNNGDTIQLLHNPGGSYVLIETVTYGDGATQSSSWSYFLEGWELASVTEGAVNQRIGGEPVNPPLLQDACPATPEIDLSPPEGYIIDSQGNCVQAPPEEPTEAQGCLVEISEISSQPNSDGQEYIELLNPSSASASLKLCKVKINTGSEQALLDSAIAPGERHVLYFPSGTIKNDGGTIVLTRSDGQILSYMYTATEQGEVVNYQTGSQQGILSNTPTPGGSNIYLLPDSEAVGGLGSGNTLADCGPGRYRHPETNRCRNLEPDEGGLAACDVGQERNPETNRCRKVTAASAGLTPCKPDQERNPETNRCRQASSSGSSLKPCEPGQERNPETNRCRKIANPVAGTSLASAAQPAALSPFQYKVPLIGLLTAALVGYGAYEYRTDIQNQVRKLREMRRRGRPPG